MSFNRCGDTRETTWAGAAWPPFVESQYDGSARATAVKAGRIRTPFAGGDLGFAGWRRVVLLCAVKVGSP